MKNICKYCGKEINPTKYTPKSFCGTKHASLWFKENKGKTIIKTCQHCGKEYYYTIGQDNYKTGERNESAEKYCCYECGKNAHMKKIKQTKLERYGNENYQNIEKIKQTKLENYGNENYNNREKMKQTKQKHYGDENYVNIEKANATKLQKYGRTNVGQFGSEEHIKSLRKKYGNTIINISQSEYYKNKRKEINEKIIKRNKITKKKNIENDPNYWNKITEKNYQTKKKNNTFNTSKEENKIAKALFMLFPDMIRQYKSEEYPFSCDFYIPSKNLYIEYQGTWTHGTHPYDKKNKEDQKIIKKWKEKSKELNFKQQKKIFYKNAIEIWTKKDPLKRKIAKKNNLNWIEFFTFEDFLEWYNKHLN